MNIVDWLIVALVLSLAPLGWRQGMIVGILALGGFAAGAVAGARLGPLVLEGGSESAYAPLAALLGGLLIGSVLAVLAEDIGTGLRRRLIGGGAVGSLDSALGVVLMSALGLAIAWVIGAAILNVPAFRELRSDVQRSSILTAAYEVAPPTGPVLNVLNRIQPTPAVRGPSADVGAPRAGVLDDPELLAASQSVVRVLGTSCGVGVSGSGWVISPGVVATNAHVIAGEDEPDVETRDGRRLDAVPIAYRPRDDIALLAVSGLELDPIPLDPDPQPGTAGAAAGFPGGGDFTLNAARLGTTGRVQSQDSYGRGPIERTMTSFRGRVRSGNSGGPVIDGEGEVLTTIFATSLSSRRPEGLGVPNDVVERLLGRAAGRADTGPCT